MNTAPTELTRADILPMNEYRAIRKERKAAVSDLKKNRRVEVGPFATFYFENYETMWIQVHEMLHIEGGGEAQIDDELSAYNPLIPKGRELVATLMFEIGDPVRRGRELGRLGGVEHTIAIEVGGESIMATPEADVERTRKSGKTSSVHFLHFSFSDAQAGKFRDPAVDVLLRIGHEHYGHGAVIAPAVRAALAKDFA